MKKTTWRAGLIILMLILAASLLIACEAKDDGAGANSEQSETEETPIVVPADAPNPVVTFTMENGAEIVVELLREKAPNTVYNFVSLVQSGFYDGLNFHRVSEGFMIQGGCPLGTGTGNPGYSIKGEFSSNGYEDNDISHIPGIISMARSSGDYDSAGCQFFICAGEATFLDGDYAAFGKTISGLKEVYEIAKLNPDDGPPETPQIIISATVDTFGVQYPKPETTPR